MNKQPKKRRKGSGKLPVLTMENVTSPWDEVLSKLAKPITTIYTEQLTQPETPSLQGLHGLVFCL